MVPWRNLVLAGFLALVAPMRHFSQRRRQSSYLLAGGISLALAGPMYLPQPGQRRRGNSIIIKK